MFSVKKKKKKKKKKNITNLSSAELAQRMVKVIATKYKNTRAFSTNVTAAFILNGTRELKICYIKVSIKTIDMRCLPLPIVLTFT